MFIIDVTIGIVKAMEPNHQPPQNIPQPNEYSAERNSISMGGDKLRVLINIDKPWWKNTKLYIAGAVLLIMILLIIIVCCTFKNKKLTKQVR
jgi:hypothetical protein